MKSLTIFCILSAITGCKVGASGGSHLADDPTYSGYNMAGKFRDTQTGKIITVQGASWDHITNNIGKGATTSRDFTQWAAQTAAAGKPFDMTVRSDNWNQAVANGVYNGNYVMGESGNRKVTLEPILVGVYDHGFGGRTPSASDPNGDYVNGSKYDEKLSSGIMFRAKNNEAAAEYVKQTGDGVYVSDPALSPKQLATGEGSSLAPDPGNGAGFKIFETENDLTQASSRLSSQVDRYMNAR